MGTVLESGTSIYNNRHGTNPPRTTLFINHILSRLAECTTKDTTPNDKKRTSDAASRHHHQSYHQPNYAFPASRLNDLKPLMLTLHCIFPNEFLLALDIIDRRLVRRILTEGQAVTANHEPDQATVGGRERTRRDSAIARKEDFYFVTSASTTSNHPFPPTTQPPPHQKNRWQTKGYEVRLQAWNCSCPAFTLSAFGNLGPEPSSPLSSSPERSSHHVNEHEDDEYASCSHDYGGEVDVRADADADDTNAYSFGGTLPMHPESTPAACKHILACLLVAVCPGLGGIGRDGPQVATLGLEEIAALCAGWGG